MSVGTLVEAVMGRRQKKEQKSADDYAALVAALANGDGVPVERVDSLLLDSAVSPSQLQSDVAELRQRRADAETAGRLPELRAQREKLSNTLVSSREALRRAEAEWREQTTKTNLAINALASEIQEYEAAERRLRAGRPDPREPGLRAEKQQLETRRRELSFELGNDGTGLRGRLKNLKAAIAGGPQPDPSEWPGRLPPSIVPGVAYDLPTLEAARDLAEIHVRGATSKLADVESRLAVVNAELDGIERRQLSAE